MKRYTILKCRRCIIVTNSISWAQRTWCSFWLPVLVRCHWHTMCPILAVGTPRLGATQAGNLQNTQHLSAAACAYSWVLFVTALLIQGCVHTEFRLWGCMTWKALTEIRLKTCFLQSWLFVCVLTGSKHKRWVLGMASGRGRAKGEASLGLSAVSAHRENQGLQCRAKAVTPAENCCCSWGGLAQFDTIYSCSNGSKRMKRTSKPTPQGTK